MISFSFYTLFREGSGFFRTSLENRKEKIPTLLILSAYSFHMVERKDKEKKDSSHSPVLFLLNRHYYSVEHFVKEGPVLRQFLVVFVIVS